MSTAHLHRVLLLKTGFRYVDRGGFFSQARLYPDRIELSSWGMRRTENRQIPLVEVDHVEWPDSPDAGATLVLAQGDRIRVRLKNLARWQVLLEQRLSFSDQRRRHAIDLPMKDLVAYTTSMS